MNTVIIIPALDPDEKLIDYVNELINNQCNRIVIVDDGSKEASQFIFEELNKKQQCIVLRHQENRGKGCALRTAFMYCLNYYSSNCDGVITVDCDGQHAVEDVVGLSQFMQNHTNSLILGVRQFNQNNVPFLSFLGNKCTCAVMCLLYGQKITDTQTGLRAIPLQILPQFVSVEGDRFEYETNMLLTALDKQIPILEKPIQTIYFNHNKGTHFRPIVDSIRIYKLLLRTFGKYILSSLSSALVDLVAFYLFILYFGQYSLGTQIGMATILARIVSSLYNYLINRRIVFEGNHHGQKTFVKYYALCFGQMIVSALSVYLFVRLFFLPKVIVKMIVDSVLFIISYRIQKILIFKGSR